jgi:hypothetical protein
MISKEDWEVHSKRFKGLSQTMRSYTRQYDLPYETFRYWYRKINNSKLDKSNECSLVNSGDFLPARIETNQSSKIILRISGVEISVERNVDREHLKGLILILKEL